MTLSLVSNDPAIPEVLPTAESWNFFEEMGKKVKIVNELTLKRYGYRLSSTSSALTWRSMQACRAYEPHVYAHLISPTPMLMIVAEGDNLAFADLALDAYNRAREPKQLLIIPGGHFDGYNGPNFEKSAGAQVEFLQRYLCS